MFYPIISEKPTFHDLKVISNQNEKKKYENQKIQK